MVTMDTVYFISVTVVAVAAFLFKMPFLGYPMDEDFASHTYHGWFRDKGIQWNKDVYIHFPQWKTWLLERISGTDYKTGVVRLRLFLALMHALTAALVFHGGYLFTGNLFAGVIAGLLFGFFATVPALYATSFNMEQLYLPFMLAAYYALLEGRYDIGGLMIGIAWTAKYSVLGYIPFAVAGAYWYSGAEAAAVTAAFSLAPITFSMLLDFMMGLYRPSVAAGLAARFANAVRLGDLKKMYGRPVNDFKEVLVRTFPVWLAGLPAIAASLTGHLAVWHALFLLPTVYLLRAQKWFSRYHYIPIVAVLSLASAGSVDFFLTMNNLYGAVGYTVIFVIAAITALKQGELYIKPTAPEILAQDRKCDQYLYLPRLGKAIKRLARMRGESGHRIFVWGNYVQLYPYTGMAAADKFVHYAIPPWDSYAKALYCRGIFEGMVRHRPRYVVLAFQDLDMELMQSVTGLKYRLIKTAFARFPVYHLVSDKNANEKLLEAPWDFQANLMQQMVEGRPHAPGINPLDVQLGFFSRALKEARKALRINPMDKAARQFAGDTLRAMGRYEEAETEYRHLIDRWPATRDARLSLAFCMMAHSDYHGASSYIDQEEKRFGLTAESLYARGMVKKFEKDHEGAERLLEEALEKNPREPNDVKLALGEVWYARGRTADAARMVEDYLEKSDFRTEGERRSRAAILLANTKHEAKDQLKVIRAFLEENPRNEVLQYAFASRLDSADKKEAAEKVFRAIIKEGKNETVKAGAYYRLACYMDNGHKQEYLRQCLRLLPTHRAARNMLEELEYAETNG